MCVEVLAVDGRRRVTLGFQLERFARCMELLAGYLQAVDARQSRSGT